MHPHDAYRFATVPNLAPYLGRPHRNRFQPIKGHHRSGRTISVRAVRYKSFRGLFGIECDTSGRRGSTDRQFQQDTHVIQHVLLQIMQITIGQGQLLQLLIDDFAL